MEREHPQFHDVDPATLRPYSGGHPDGVWMIAILYALGILAALVPGILGLVALASDRPVDAGAFLPFLAACVLFLPAIVLFFRRRKAVVAWTAGVFVLTLLGAALAVAQLQQAHGLTGPRAVALAGAVTATGLVALYARGLKRDHLVR